ncbi:unnamed protein product [Medioppia subpectinata]|nr:unnamed protein product [Medioppia subpectinata]CAG2116575.1 unnamed protein product [Medioppia subpectinata]
MKFLHLMKILEILHPLMGYTSGSALMPSIQLFGRVFLIFFMVDSEPKIHANPWVIYLFFVYTISEMIRYPYYMLHVFNVNIGFLTTIRYTAWILLYPLGFLCEGVILYNNITYLEESKRFSIGLPNDLNFSLHMPTIIRLYLLFGFFPALYFMMNHMNRQRIKVFNTNRSKSKVH